MHATIDAGGRAVVPKEVRDRLGLRPGSRVELVESDGRLEITPATTRVRLQEDNGVVVAETDEDVPTLTAEQVRDVIEAARR